MEPNPKELQVQAALIGERIDMRVMAGEDRLAVDPLTIRAGTGIAVVFRDGAVVFFDVGPLDVRAFPHRLAACASQPLGHTALE